MIFLGTKVVQNKLPSERKVCPNCMSVTEHDVVDVDTRFTLYFFPLFSIKRDVVYRCLTCGDAHTMPFTDYLDRHETEMAAWQVNKVATDTEAGGGKQQTQKEKARVILEGKVIDGNLKQNLNFDPDALLRQFWVVFIIFALVAIAAILLVAALLAR